MVITTLSIMAITYFSGRHFRKKAMKNLSEEGKQKVTQAALWPKMFMPKESFNQQGLKYRRILFGVIILGLILVVFSFIY